MFVRGTVRIGRIAGIDIAIHASWIVIYVLMAWSITQIAPSDLGRRGIIELGLVVSLLLFASVVAHELSHAIVARRLGIPIGNITLFLFGGVASIKHEPGTPADELKVAVAGPAMSVLLCLVCYAIGSLLPQRMEWGGLLWFLLAWMNLALAAFNLLPAFPSDGGRILRALLWKWSRSQAIATGWAGVVSMIVAVLLVAGGIWVVAFGGEYMPGAYHFVRGWWIILIALFLGQAAYASIRGARFNRILETMPVKECMARTLIPVPAATSIAGFVGELAVNGRGTAYPVVSEGAPIGLVTLQDTSAVPHVLWQHTPVTAVMTPSDRTPGIGPDVPAYEALVALDERHVGELPVYDRGELVGVVSKESIYGGVRAKERAALR